MGLEIPISERARRWGYVFWTKKMDKEVRPFLNKHQRIDVWFDDSKLGLKNIDYENRRISVGYKLTRPLPAEISTFVLSLDKKGVLKIKCR